MPPSLTYVFCLVRSAKRPRTIDSGEPATPSMPGGAELRALALDAGRGGQRNDLWLIAASVPATEYGEVALARGLQDLDWVGACAVAHEAVIERFLTARAVLPMQLFTLFTSDERALEHVRKDRRRVRRLLAKIDRQLEWGLRLTWDEKAARALVEDRHAVPAKRQATAQPAVSGASYLARKRDLLDVNRVQLAEARRGATRVYRALAARATDARRRTSTERAAPGSRLLLDAAFLVPVTHAAAFRAALGAQARTLDGSGIVASLTGPWPPYNFIR